jgi:hypothetical protein
MPELRGIPGVKSGFVKCETVSTVTELMRTVRPALGVCAAGDSGSISVWVGDNHFFFASFYRYQQEIGSGIFPNRNQLRKWLARWWPEMGDRNKEARRAA